MGGEESAPPSQLLRQSAARWLGEQGVRCDPEDLRVPLDPRYGDAVLPAHLGYQLPAADRLMPEAGPGFTAHLDNAGNLQLLLDPFHAAALLESAERWLTARGRERPLEVDKRMSDDGARAVLRVAGLWRHCTEGTNNLPGEGSYTQLADSEHAHHTMRLLLRADRVGPGEQALYNRRLAESIGNIYHRERVLFPPYSRRDAWLRLLLVACSVLRP